MSDCDLDDDVVMLTDKGWAQLLDAARAEIEGLRAKLKSAHDNSLALLANNARLRSKLAALEQEADEK